MRERHKIFFIFSLVCFVVLSFVAVLSSFFREVICHLKDLPLATCVGVILFFIGALYFAVAMAWLLYSKSGMSQIKFKLNNPTGNLALSIIILMIAFVLIALGIGLK